MSLERGLAEVVLAEIHASAPEQEWQMLSAFLGFVDRHFSAIGFWQSPSVIARPNGPSSVRPDKHSGEQREDKGESPLTRTLQCSSVHEPQTPGGRLLLQRRSYSSERSKQPISEINAES
jgi:hypothetical protein